LAAVESAWPKASALAFLMDSPFGGFRLAVAFGGFQFPFLIFFGGSHFFGFYSFGDAPILIHFWDVSPVIPDSSFSGFSFTVLKFTLSEYLFL
jgi:hypothetical protein